MCLYTFLITFLIMLFSIIIFDFEYRYYVT